MSDLFLVTSLAGLVLIVGGMVLAYLGDYRSPKRATPRSDAHRRAQLELATRLGNGRKQ